MDRQLMEKGLATRRAVLGDEYVDRAMKNADGFNLPFQEVVSNFLPAGATKQLRGANAAFRISA